MLRNPKSQEPSISIAAVLSSMKSTLFAIALVSAVVNILALTGSFFMLQVYDRVIPGRSVPTLVGLIVLAALLYVFYGVLEFLRSRLLIRVGWSADQKISRPIYDAAMRFPLKAKLQGDGLQSIRDLDQVRSFLSGMGPSAFFDLPWMPAYLALCFLFHLWIGIFASVCAVLLAVLAVLTDIRSRHPVASASEKAATRSGIAQAVRQNIDVLWAMGFYHRMAERWHAANNSYLAAQAKASDTSGGFGSITKVIRMMAQSGMLALGAVLVLRQEATGGIMIASSILLSRTLAPVELAISHWKGFVSARQSLARLSKLVTLIPKSEPSVALPPPSKSLTLRSVTISPPGVPTPVVLDASFALSA